MRILSENYFQKKERERQEIKNIFLGVKWCFLLLTEHCRQSPQHCDRTTSDDRYEGSPGALPLPIPRPDDLGCADEAAEDGPLYVAAWGGSHG